MNQAVKVQGVGQGGAEHRVLRHRAHHAEDRRRLTHPRQLLSARVGQLRRPGAAGHADPGEALCTHRRAQPQDVLHGPRWSRRQAQYGLDLLRPGEVRLRPPVVACLRLRRAQAAGEEHPGRRSLHAPRADAISRWRSALVTGRRSGGESRRRKVRQGLHRDNRD
eukprot:11605075-Heterocapsa_arctica.AAC.1